MERSKPSSTPTDLLIIHSGALGDVVVMFGLIAQLGRRYQKTTLVCRESVGRLAAKLNLVDRSLSIETAWWATLFRENPDERALAFLSAHHRIILFAVNAELEQIINSCVSIPCLRVPPRPPAENRIHVTRFAAAFLVEHGLIDQIPSSRTAMCRQTPSGAAAPAQKGQAPILLHPGAGSKRKRWPLSDFLEVAAQISSVGGNPQLIIGPADRDLLAATRNSGLPIQVLSELHHLLELLASATGFIGNDAGVAHLAACLGLPTVVIFTASDPERWRPNGPAVAALSPALPCQPCFETQEANCPQPECLKAVTPDTVLKSFYSLCKEQIDDRSGK